MTVGTWRNNKTGADYIVMYEALHSETMEEMVVYKRSDIVTKSVWVRPKKLFLQKFTRVT